MQVHLSAWGRVLADVPTDDLDAAFTRAARLSNDDRNITPTAIRVAYEELSRERFFDQQAQQRRATTPPPPRGTGVRPGYVPGPVDDYDEMHRILTPEENQAEYEYWAKWLEAKRAAKGAGSSSGMTPLGDLLGTALGGHDDE
jgi:hypothetical protein